MNELSFKKALTENDIIGVTMVAKSELHNHSMLGSHFGVLEKFAGRKLKKAPSRMCDFAIFQDYLNQLFKPYLVQEGFFDYMIRAAFMQAKLDGVAVLQMSIDSRFYDYFPKKELDIIEIIEKARKDIAPEINFIPQLGLERAQDYKMLEREALAMIECGYFKSIDLYGDELACDFHLFIPIYRKAKQYNMILCAHAGEYGSAESVREAAEVLELQQVQHGIAAATSVEVMKWLSSNKILLNVCPTSNVVLCRAESIKKHPIRKLFDNGVKVTINTDDLMIFGQSVSDEYLNLFREGVFTADELDLIRLTGLNIV